MHMRIVFTLIVVLVSGYLNEAKAQALVDVQWVDAALKQSDFVFLDLRSGGAYDAGHVPGAINDVYSQDRWRVRPLVANDEREIEAAFNRHMEELGIANASHVVLIHAGKTYSDASDAAFVYWYFKLLGHEKISILNGGMAAYVASAIRIETDEHAPPPSEYHSKFQRGIRANISDVEAFLATDGTLVDYRPASLYLGVNKAFDISRYGTVAGAKNLPGDWLTFDGGGALRSDMHLRRLFEQQKIRFDLPHIAFSNYGEAAALGWFVAHEILGNQNVMLYDHSLREWSANLKNPMQRLIGFE